MRKKFKYLVLFFVFPILTINLSAGQKSYRVIGYEGDIYFGHITYLEPLKEGEPALIKHWGSEESMEALLNSPLMPGDTVLSRDTRLEIQLDNGTIIRLDRHAELFLQTVLAPTLSSNKKVTNIVLAKGSVYVMYKEYDGSELFQILTHKSAVKLDHHSVSIIKTLEDGSSEVVVTNGRVWLMAPPIPNKKEPTQLVLDKGWRAKIIAPLGTVEAELYAEPDEFLAWNEEINAHFDFYHEGSVLPKPLSHLPLAVHYFAQRYGSIYGEWIWHELYGYVWRPFYNDYYPWGSWEPYFYGRWLNIGGTLFWIPQEPWGWVPYHLGFWMWDKKKGWLWIPGSVFAPAWTVWDYFFGFYSWRPWSLFDWYLATYYGPLGYNTALSEYYYRFVRNEIPATEIKPVLEKIRKDQLKKASSEEKLSPPKEVKKITELVLKALEKGDPEIRESLRQTVTNFILISKDDFKPDFSQEKILRFKDALERGQINFSTTSSSLKKALPQEILKSTSLRERPITVQDETLPSVLLREKIEPSNRVEPTRGEVKLPDRLKIIDWNPDVRIARRLGYDIVYDSQRNEVRCPQLGLGSKDLAFRRIISFPEGGFMRMTNPFAEGAYSGSLGSPSSPVYSGGAERTGTGSPSREGGAGRSGEKK